MLGSNNEAERDRCALYHACAAQPIEREPCMHAIIETDEGDTMALQLARSGQPHGAGSDDGDVLGGG